MPSEPGSYVRRGPLRPSACWRWCVSAPMTDEYKVTPSACTGSSTRPHERAREAGERAGMHERKRSWSCPASLLGAYLQLPDADPSMKDAELRDATADLPQGRHDAGRAARRVLHCPGRMARPDVEQTARRPNPPVRISPHPRQLPHEQDGHHDGAGLTAVRWRRRRRRAVGGRRAQRPASAVRLSARRAAEAGARRR